MCPSGSCRFFDALTAISNRSATFRCPISSLSNFGRSATSCFLGSSSAGPVVITFSRAIGAFPVSFSGRPGGATALFLLALVDREEGFLVVRGDGDGDEQDQGRDERNAASHGHSGLGLLLLALEGEEHHGRLLLRLERGGSVLFFGVNAQDDGIAFEFVNARQVAALER